MMAGQQRICAWVYSGAFVVNVALNFSLIPAFGLVGAAVATAAALIVETAMLYVTVRRRLGISCSILTAFRQAPALTEAS
jgi:O-antigen/teichoic acid export membrane protein